MKISEFRQASKLQEELKTIMLLIRHVERELLKHPDDFDPCTPVEVARIRVNISTYDVLEGLVKRARALSIQLSKLGMEIDDDRILKVIADGA